VAGASDWRVVFVNHWRFAFPPEAREIFRRSHIAAGLNLFKIQHSELLGPPFMASSVLRIHEEKERIIEG
jgi:hypothetical protein